MVRQQQRSFDDVSNVGFFLEIPRSFCKGGRRIQTLVVIQPITAEIERASA
jgi:hypothetical protein